MDASTTYLVQQNFLYEMSSLKDKSQMMTEPLSSFHDHLSILQKCKKDRDFIHVKSLHTHFHAVGLEGHNTIGSYLVQLFVDCGSIDH
eukprot:c9142_g1_i1 orf=641-904(+)